MNGCWEEGRANHAGKHRVWDKAKNDYVVKSARIQMGLNTPTSTWIHEYGHHIEDQHKKLATQARQFLRKRTRKDPLRKLKDITGNTGYEDHEVAKADKFYDPYVGKDYSKGGLRKKAPTEVTSMGIEKLYADPLFLLEKDIEHFIFSWDLIRGRLFV
jgi:hypothetical protein